MSLPWHLPVDPAPRLLVLPPDASSLDEADAAIELWEHYKRRQCDPWQRLSVQLKMATRPDGRWAALTTCDEVGRQAGKGDAEEIVELWGLVQRAERILHTIHDAVLLATEAHGRMLSLIDGHADLRRKKLRAWSGTGQQMVEMRNGGIIWYRTRAGGGGGRGVDEVDRVVIDEAQHAELGQVEALSPTQLMSVNPQTNVMGTGGLDGKSGWWWSLRRRGLLPDPGDFSYLGFTAERLSVVDGRIDIQRPDISTLDLFLEQVHKTHPVLQRRPDKVAFLAEEYRKLGAEAAALEYLCFWAPEPDADVQVVMPNWPLVVDPSSVIASHRQWALAVSPDRKWGSVGVAGRRADGDLHVEWMAHRSMVQWDVVADVSAGYRNTKIPIRIHVAGPEAAFIAPLRAAGVDVVEVSTAEAAQATGQIIDAVMNQQLHHLGQPSLDKAVAGAVLRVGSDGASVWSEKNSAVEITPLRAVTVALGGVPAAAPVGPNAMYSW